MGEKEEGVCWKQVNYLNQMGWFYFMMAEEHFITVRFLIFPIDDFFSYPDYGWVKWKTLVLFGDV